MPDQDNKLLKYNHGEKSLRGPFIIYAECLLKKIHLCQSNLEKSYTEKKKTKDMQSSYSLFTNCSFDAKKKLLQTSMLFEKIL